jgi:chemotaxis protein MotB
MSSEKPRVKIVENVITVEGAPAYMVSFGDMMTLILCFFILMVALAEERNFGMMAKGLGSFVVAVESHGLNGVLSGEQRAEIFSEVRRRFNLPPEEDPERRPDSYERASSSEMVRAEMVDALKPRREIHQPGLARFSLGSAVLSTAAEDYLDAQADSLRPANGQLLLLEGHAPADQADGTALAFARARAVADYLIEEHRYNPVRVSARAWIIELNTERRFTDGVNARLVFPPEQED